MQSSAVINRKSLWLGNIHHLLIHVRRGFEFPVCRSRTLTPPPETPEPKRDEVNVLFNQGLRTTAS